MPARPASAKTMERRYKQFGRDLARAEDRTRNLIHITASTSPLRSLCSRHAAVYFNCPDIECPEHAYMATCAECVQIAATHA